MNNKDARIDRVLQRLREAEPADGLDERVLRAVQERAPGTIDTRRAGIWRVFPLTPQWSAVAAAVLVGTLLFWSINRQTRYQQTRSDAASISSRPEPTIDPTPPAHLAVLPPITQPSAAAKLAAKLPRKPSVQGSRGQPDILLAGGNHPAPEAPLTDEERLLLRISHRGAPEQFAVLNPDARDAQAKSDKAEFQKFFGPPPPPTGDNE